MAVAKGIRAEGEVKTFYTRFKSHQESHKFNRRKNFLGVKIIKQ